MEEIKKELVPWQRRGELGFFKAWIETIKQVLFRPEEFFNNLDKKSIIEPFIFYFTIAYPTYIIEKIVRLAMKSELSSGALFLIPIAALLDAAIWIFGGTAISHLFILLFGGKGGFKGTFNVYAYSYAVAIFPIILFAIGLLIGLAAGIGLTGGIAAAFLGGLITLVLIIKINIIGLKKVHNFTTLRAFCAYLLVPIIIPIIALLVAIAIPNLLRARRDANEYAAKSTITAISKALESYSSVNNGQYPLSEYDLKKGNYLSSSQYYSNNIVGGYSYSLNLRRDGYEIVATPVTCGTMGTKIFTAQTNASLSEKDCK